MGGEGCAAHTDDAAFTDDAHQILGSQCIHFFLSSGLDVRAQLVLVVIFDDNTHHHGAVGVRTVLNCLDGTGNGCVDRDAQALIVTDLLTDRNAVALLDQGRAGCADVLRHGDYQNIRFGETQDLPVFSVVLIFFGMNSSEKGKRHNCHLFQFLRT